MQGGAACEYPCACALRARSGLLRFRKPARACVCVASAVPGCRFLHDAGIMVLAGLHVLSVLLLAAVHEHALRECFPIRPIALPDCVCLCVMFVDYTAFA